MTIPRESGLRPALAILCAAAWLCAAPQAAWSAPAPRCPDLPRTTARPPAFLDLADILRFPAEPRPDLERTPVTTEGYVARSLRLRQPAARCQPGGFVYRLWLTANRPHGLKGAAQRHRAVVATVAEPLFRRAFGKGAGTVGRRHLRIRLTGYPVYEPRDHSQHAVSRGTPWELRAVSEIGAAEKHPTAE